MGFLRLHQPGTFHFITNRCEHEQFLMQPSKEINQIILNWLVKAHSKYGKEIEVFAFIFLGNHFHLLIRNNGRGLAQFMCYLQSNIAKEINLHWGRNGRFFSREYDDVIVEGDDAFLNRYCYVHSNAVKAGLVDTASQWPGVNSLPYALKQKSIHVNVLNKTKLHNATRKEQKVDKQKFMDSFKMSIAVPPMWAHKSKNEIKSLIQEHLKSAEHDYHKQRSFKPTLGEKKVLEQKHTDRPKKTSRSPRFKIMCFDKDRKKELIEGYKKLINYYKLAIDVFRTSASIRRHPVIEWPSWCYPPSSTYPILEPGT